MCLVRIIGNVAGPALYYLGVGVGRLNQTANPVFRAGRVRSTSRYRLCVLKKEWLEIVEASVKRCLDATSRRLTADFGSWMRVPFVHIVYASQEQYRRALAWGGDSHDFSPRVSDGVFHADIATVFIGMESAFPGVCDAILVHELVHAAMSRWEAPRSPRCLWAAEGYADNVAYDAAMRQDVLIERYLQIDQVGVIPSADEFRAMLNITSNKELSLSMRFAAEMFVRYLLTRQDPFKKRAKDFLLGVLLGYWRSETFVACCENALGRDIRQIEAEYRDFCEIEILRSLALKGAAMSCTAERADEGKS